MDDEILDGDSHKREKFPSSLFLFSFLGIVLLSFLLRLINFPYSGWILIYSVPVLLAFGILRAVFYPHNTFNRFLPLFFSLLMIRRIYIHTILNDFDLAVVSGLFLLSFVLGYVFLDWKK